MKQFRQFKGFTLVELLIVIVVIGILAGISLIAYSGVSQRANDSKTLALVDDWKDVIGVYQSKNQYLPNDWTCLGNTVNDFPTDGPNNYGLGVCERNIVVTYTGSDWSSEYKTAPTASAQSHGQTLSTPQLLATNTNLPSGGLPVYTYTGGGQGTSPFIRGIIYAVISDPTKAPNSQPGAYIIYVLKTRACPTQDVYKTLGNLNICANMLTNAATWGNEISPY